MQRNDKISAIVDVESPEDQNLLLAPWANNHQIVFTKGNSHAVAIPSPRTPSSIFSFTPRSPTNGMR